MSTNAMTVAQYLSSKHVFGKTHLLKLVYYVQGWSLAWTGRPMFDEQLQAWKNGPVVYSVWDAMKTGPLPRADGSLLTATDRAIIDSVYAFYGNHGGATLSKRTHEERAWIEARGGLPAQAPSNAEITLPSMMRSFVEETMSGRSVPQRPTSIDAPAASTRVQAAAARNAARWSRTLQNLATR